MLTEEFCSQQTILFLTEYHKVEVLKSNHAWFILTGLSTVLQIMIAKEVILFFGASQFQKNNTRWRARKNLRYSGKCLLSKWNPKMICRTICKRLILNPHIQRANRVDHIWQKSIDIVREYNYLVESNFKTKHQVADYAEMLNKSPKNII
jgi:hypothetical protein